MPVCKECGGEDFDLHDGLYFCVECNTQSQIIREQTEEDDHHETILSRLAISTPTEKKKNINDVCIYGEQWNTHQCFNIIICRQVEKLIELGASLKLKEIVFNLWAKYLKECEIAFIGKKADKDWLPKLGTLPNTRDIFVLYKNKKQIPRQFNKKNLHNEVRENIETTVKSKEIIEVTNTEKSMECESSQGKNKNKIRNSKKDSKIIENDENYERKLEFSKQAKTKIDKTVIRGKNQIIKFDDVMTIEKTLAFCYLGLLLVEDSILISDIIRWAREDNFPYVSVSYLLPSSMVLQAHDWKLITPYKLPELKIINELTGKLACFLGIKEIPTKPLMPIVARFVLDLNLPLELISIIHKLMNKKKIPYTKLNVDGIPKYELRAMSTIIIALKLLFGLNDKSERKLSSLGRELEEYNNLDNHFFIWDDWVQYIKAQMNFISHAHIPLAVFMENDVYDIDKYSLFYDQVIHNHWKPKATPKSHRSLKGSIELHNSLKKLFTSLNKKEEEIISYPKTSFPFTTWTSLYRKMYFQHNSNKKIYHHHSLAYLINCKDFYSDPEILKMYQNQDFDNLFCNTEDSHVPVLPYTQYWIAHFHKTLVPEIPYNSFRWLLSVCSHYIEMTPEDIYWEITQLEKCIFKNCPELKDLPKSYYRNVNDLKEKNFNEKIIKPVKRKKTTKNPSKNLKKLHE